VANYSEKGKELDNNIKEEEERGQDLRLSMPMMFPGFHREGEMSAMVSALTHVICGDQNNDDFSVLNQNMNHTAFHQGDGNPFVSATTSSTSLSNGDSSSLKRRREDNGFFHNSSSTFPPNKHQGEYLYYNLIKSEIKLGFSRMMLKVINHSSPMT
jgi:hypothetical protein